MSKIGKRAILILLALPIVINVMAQETKKLTLEDLIPAKPTAMQKTCTACNGGEMCVSNQVPTPSTPSSPKRGKRRYSLPLNKSTKYLQTIKQGNCRPRILSFTHGQTSRKCY